MGMNLFKRKHRCTDPLCRNEYVVGHFTIHPDGHVIHHSHGQQTNYQSDMTLKDVLIEHGLLRV